MPQPSSVTSISVEPALAEPDRDVGRARVDRVFDQFLERRGRALDHFARGDAVDQGFGQAADCPASSTG